jgi:hypothetical protein
MDISLPPCFLVATYGQLHPPSAIPRQIHACRVVTSATSVMKYVRCNLGTSCARVAPAQGCLAVECSKCCFHAHFYGAASDVTVWLIIRLVPFCIFPIFEMFRSLLKYHFRVMYYYGLLARSDTAVVGSNTTRGMNVYVYSLCVVLRR